MFAEIKDQKVLETALSLCRGSYQRDILRGYEALSGSTLRGRARDYRDRYKRSAQSIMCRCQKAGLAVREEVRARGKRVVVIG